MRLTFEELGELGGAYFLVVQRMLAHTIWWVFTLREKVARILLIAAKEKWLMDV